MKRLIPILICSLIFAIYVGSGRTELTDSAWVIPTAESIIREGDTELSEYRKIQQFKGDISLYEHDGAYYNFFPLGPSLIALPFTYTYILYQELFSQKKMRAARRAGWLGKLIASLLTALSILILYYAGPETAERRKLFVCIIMAFGTSYWSVTSRGMWQHGPSILMLSLAILLLVKAEKNSKYLSYVSAPLSLSYLMRPTNAIPIILITAYVIIKDRQQLPKYVAYAVPATLLFALHNWLTYDSLLSPYYQAGRLEAHQEMFEAMAANLISAGRGLFIYSPILLLSLFGISKKIPLSILFTLIILSHLIVISCFPHWWAGHSYGPRLFSDMLPFFGWLLMQNICSIRLNSRNTTLIVILSAISLFAHLRGAHHQVVHNWNSKPLDIDESPRRIWNYRDIPYLRGLKRFTRKR